MVCMKTSTQRVHNLLLAIAMAVPLWAANGAACANDMASQDTGAGADANELRDQRRPMMHGGPDQDRPDSGPRTHGGMPLFSAAGMGGRAGEHGGGRAPFLRGVALTEAQEDKVFAILHAEKPYLRDQAKAAAKAREALQAMAGADKYDDAEAASLAQAAGAAMANIALQRVRTEQKLRAVLTPEQRKAQAEDKGKDKGGKDKPQRPRP
jgi:Spy/CpxP family protein refolding chaperone